MNWKQYLLQLEHQEQWDEAIAYMEDIVATYPNDVDVYIYLNFLIMNTLVESAIGSYDESNNEYYKELLLESFKISYEKFSDNPEYLFCTTTTAVFSEWYMGIEPEDYESMFRRARELAPDNLLYKKHYYLHLDRLVPSQQAEKVWYAKLILQEDSPLIKEWAARGSLGEYLRDIQTGWAEDVLDWEVRRYDPQEVWRAHLDKLFLQIDPTIEFMQATIANDPNDMQAYMHLIYFLINLLVNEKYDAQKYDHYGALLNKYFNESYLKFSNNPEYLFCVGLTISMRTNLLGLEPKDVAAMLAKAMELAPDNVLYGLAEYLYLNPKAANQTPLALDYAQQALQNDSELGALMIKTRGLNSYLRDKIFKWTQEVRRAHAGIESADA